MTEALAIYAGFVTLMLWLVAALLGRANARLRLVLAELEGVRPTSPVLRILRWRR
jgi:hypothetical protein